MEEYGSALEYSPPWEEGPAKEPLERPQEWAVPSFPATDLSLEFGGRSGGAKEEKVTLLHRLVKKIMLMPIVASAAVITLVFSATGYDPLGEDFLSHDAHEHHSDYDEERGNSGGGEKGGKGSEIPLNIYEDAFINVTYVPTGDGFTSSETGEDGMREAREWVESVGGDPDSMVYLRTEEVYAGYELSDDAIVVGDGDNIDNLYVAQGTLTKLYKNIAYFEAYEKGGQPQDIAGQEPSDNELEGFPIWVTHVPSGESYYPYETGRLGLEEAKDWLRSIGGDPDTLEFVSFKRDDKYEIDDGVLSHFIITYAYYEAYGEGEPVGDAFPALSNMDPDFAGEYAYEKMGSEIFVRFLTTDNNVSAYVLAGEAWQDRYGATEGYVQGCTYDRDQNTLTLSGIQEPDLILDVNQMGNGFKIRLVGENSLGGIVVWGAEYAGSVTFCGSGTLHVGQNGLLLRGECSESCVMVERYVTIEIDSPNPIVILDTTIGDDPIRLQRPMQMVGGSMIYDDWSDYGNGIYVRSFAIVLDDSAGSLLLTQNP